ncbi:MAG: bifunctional phosphoribosylaminoimidazolecarboxamide formyltransferase/IMP cyclohydrolase [Actinomycetota bacterium]
MGETDRQVRPVRRALIAVADKGGLVGLAPALHELGIAIVSSGGTAAAIRELGVPVTRVADVTGFPEMLGGRVKTLHPGVHGGILADRRDAAHVQQLAEHGIEPIDLVVVNLYPFRETVASGAASDEIVENIDIGGPAMVRAAAKNFESVGVVVNHERYPSIVEELRREGGLTRETRERLAAEAFAYTAAYDTAIAGWFADRLAGQELPATLGLALTRLDDLRYGENPHQRAALYGEVAAEADGPLGGAQVLQGKAMSLNNWLDAESAMGLVAELPVPSCVIVKHNNPCGAATAASLADAYQRAFACDTVSAFGGIVAFNAPTDAAAAEAMSEVFTEVVIAPSFDEGALASFRSREKLRVVRASVAERGGIEVRPIHGGALVQERDVVDESRAQMHVVSDREPTDQEWSDLLFAWIVAARVKSNAIVLAKDGATVGVGAGQMSRVDAAWIAVRKAEDRAAGAAMASDAFFPFPDALQVCADAGVTAVIHPGGSVRDEEVLAEAERRGMAVVVTGRRHFRH